MVEERARIEQLTDPAELETLRPLWLALHHHHRGLPDSPPLQPDDDVSWRGRSATYRGWLADGSAVILTATVEGEVVGYAVAHLESGADDDTFDLGDRYAELYTLSVLPAQRGQRVGSHLLDALDDVLRARSVATITVGAMAGNARTLAFYRRRGFEPVEVTFQRPVS